MDFENRACLVGGASDPNHIIPKILTKILELESQKNLILNDGNGDVVMIASISLPKPMSKDAVRSVAVEHRAKSNARSGATWQSHQMVMLTSSSV